MTNGSADAILRASASLVARRMVRPSPAGAPGGALNGPEGCVTITGTRHDDRLTLTWQERGGPAVEGPPQRRGFGTVLAERGAITQLGGSIAHDWAEAGLTLRLDVPLERLAH